MMTIERESTPTLVLNPPDDDDFRAAAIGAVEAGVVAPSVLERALRKTYAKAIVRPRELAGERGLIWYVYRDGKWVRPSR